MDVELQQVLRQQIRGRINLGDDSCGLMVFRGQFKGGNNRLRIGIRSEDGAIIHTALKRELRLKIKPAGFSPVAARHRRDGHVGFQVALIGVDTLRSRPGCHCEAGDHNHGSVASRFG